MDVMLLCQVVGQQRGGPHRGAIAQLPWVAIDDVQDQGLNDALSRPGTPRACAVGEAGCQIASGGPLETCDPVVDGTTTDAQACRDLLDRVTRIEPQQCLGTAE